MPSVFCCVTLDVEVDKDLEYRVSAPPRFRNVTEAIPELLEPLFQELGVRPTYLLSSEVMQDAESVHILRKLQSEHELGTHGHAELLGPGIDVKAFQGKPMYDFICDYPPEIQSMKLSWLTELFFQTFGYRPLSFRAGRFGVNSQVLKILADLGYQIDSSVTPGLFWRSHQQVVNFITAPEQPYRPDENDINQPGNLRILEAPVSSWESSQVGRRFRQIIASNNNILAILPNLVTRVLLRTICRFRWLRPTNYSGKTLIRWCDEFIRRHKQNKKVFIVIMFHPIELIPGASIYSKNTKEAMRIYNNLRTTLLYLKNIGTEFITLSQTLSYVNN